MMKGLVGGVLLAATLVGQAQAAEQVTLRMSWWGGNSRHQATLAAIDAFQKKYPEVTVKAEYTGWEGYLSRLTTQMASGEEPDVMQLNWNWIPIFSREGTGFYDLNNQKEVLKLQDFPIDALTTVNGKVNAISASLNGLVMYYNADTWKKAGVAYPKTWDELFLAGKVFKEKLGDNYFPLASPAQDNGEGVLELINTYMTQKFKVGMINEQTKSFNYTDEQWLEAFRFYKRLVDEHVMPSARYYNAFGKSGVFETRPWITGEYGGAMLWASIVKKYADPLAPPAKLELGPYIMTPGSDNPGQFFKPSMLIAVSKNSKHPKEAAMLLNFLMNDPQGSVLMGTERGVPLSRVARQALQDNQKLDEKDLSVKGLMLALQYPMQTPVSTYIEDPQLASLMLQTIEQLDYGNKTVEMSAKGFSDMGNRILKRVIR
ncbi:Sugar-binding protein precursor [Dickeya aquatica]|uniref:Sugar-binding protein n=2 Tax=Pectobacteriaceae TaxID=1903410 RepID=A0A375AE16_9GAMM|nr:Sugar-binding protein precursor [Dickeya aquatica]